MRRRGLTVATGVAWAALLVGCTTTNSGHAEPAPPTAVNETSTTSTQPSRSVPSGQPLPSDGAPKVKNPLDVSRFQLDPCLALTATQARELNVPSQGAPIEAPLGKACEWRNAETRGSVQLRFLDKNPRGLSGAYAANKAGEYKYFLELPEIEGFPAVAIDRADGLAGSCMLAVGVSDPVAFTLPLQLSRANVGQKDPCEVTVQVAGMMLRTMKAGG